MPDHPMPYTIVRSNRRTLAVCVLPDGRVEARAPRRFPAAAIERFVRQKADWIAARQTEALGRNREREVLRPAPGGTLPLGGVEYPLVAGESFGFNGERFTLPAEGWPAARSALIALYGEKTRELAEQRLGGFAARLGVKPAEVKVSRAVRRWGSCSGKGSLNFSWMLAAADLRAVDYVLVHELCHLSEPNHSAAFWRLVEEVLPDYRERKRLLRQTERRLSVLTEEPIPGE